MDLDDSLDTTQELLDDTLPSTPDVVDSVIQDDSEDEIFFGNISSKEKNGKNATFNRRLTIGMSESDRRRSFEKSKPAYKIKSRDVFSLRDSVDSRTSLYGSEKSITEEDGLDDVFADGEKEASPEAITENLASLNLKMVDVTDDGDCVQMEVEHNTEIGQSFEQEGLRTSTKDDQIRSFNIQDKSDKTDDDVDCTQDSELFENNTVVGDDINLDLPSNIEVPCAQVLPEHGAIEDRVPTQVPTLVLSPTGIKYDGDQSISKDESLSEALQYGKSVDSMETLSTDNSQPFINNESLSTNAHNDSSAGQSQPFISVSISTDESPTDVKDNSSSTDTDGPIEIVHSHGDISNSLPRPALQDTNLSQDLTHSICDIQDSFFSNAASNSISGIEPLDDQTLKSFNNDSIQSGSSGSEFELGRLTSTSPLERSRTGDILLHVEKENAFALEASSSSQLISGKSPENGNNFLSVPTARHQRDAQEQDVAAKNNFSLPSPNTIAQELSPVSRERMLSLMEHSTTDDSSGDDSVFSNNCLDSNIEVTASESFFHLENIEDTNSVNDITKEVKNGDTLHNETQFSAEVDDAENEELEAKPLDKDTLKDILDTTTTEADDDDLLEDIKLLDVDNDQLFDDSLMTEDNTSRRLSSISNKICKKWKNKEKQTSKSCDETASKQLISITEDSIAENVNTTQENVNDTQENVNDTQENVNDTQEGFCSVLESLPNSRDVSVCQETEEFDNTADEMVLYEMFGGDYDEIVEKMTADEKKELRKQLDARTEEDKQQTEENLKMQLSVPTLSPSPSPKIQKNHMETFGTTSPVAILDHSLEPTSFAEKDCFPEQASPARSSSTEPLFKSPNFIRQTASSLHKRVTPSPSPSNNIPWRPISPHGKSFIPTPVRFGTLVRTPLLTTPQLRTTPGSGTLARNGLLTTPQLSGSMVRTPGSSAKTKGPTSRAAQVDMNQHAIVSPSPLGTYLRDNKPPPLVHQVKAQSAVRDLESTLMEVENLENEPPETVCPLPEARYYGNAPNLDQENCADPNDYHIAEAYGQTNTLAKVTRHVGRVKVAGKTPGIRWGEDLASDQSLMSSPSHTQLGPAGKSVLKKTQRDSGTFDESMVNVSVLETVTIKKIGRKNKKK